MRVKLSEIRSEIRRLLTLSEGRPAIFDALIIDALTQFGPMTAAQIAEKISKERVSTIRALNRMTLQGSIVLTDEVPLAGKKHKDSAVYDIPNRAEAPSRASEIVPEKNAYEKHKENILNILSSGPKSREELMNVLGLRGYRQTASVLRDLLAAGDIVKIPSDRKSGVRGKSIDFFALQTNVPEDLLPGTSAYENELLNFLKKSGPSTISAICDRMPGSTRQYIFVLLKKLQAKGLADVVGTKREKLSGPPAKVWAATNNSSYAGMTMVNSFDDSDEV